MGSHPARRSPNQRLVDCRLGGSSPATSALVDSRFRGNDGKRRLERVYFLEIPFATAGTGPLAVAGFRGNGEGHATCNEPRAEGRRKPFGRVRHDSVELDLRQVQVLRDLCRRVLPALRRSHEENRRLTDPALKKPVEAGEKDWQFLLPAPIPQGNTALQNGFEITFEALPILVSV